MTKLWTIGYAKVGIPDFIAALTAARIKTLIDVREVANARRAGFSKKALTTSLDEAGITYIHMRALGTPKAGRDASRKGDKETMRQVFDVKLQSPESQLALAEVAELAGQSRTCLMCLEHDWQDCHRAIVAERLEGFGLQAQHLAPTPSV